MANAPWQRWTKFISPGVAASPQAGAAGWRLVGVANSCDERGHAALRGATADEPRVRVVVAESNLGYFGGARRGLVEVDPTTVAWTVVANVLLNLDGVLTKG